MHWGPGNYILGIYMEIGQVVHYPCGRIKGSYRPDFFAKSKKCAPAKVCLFSWLCGGVRRTKATARLSEKAPPSEKNITLASSGWDLADIVSIMRHLLVF